MMINIAAQLLNTPDLYGDQFVASTLTAKGLAINPALSSLQREWDVNPLILNNPQVVVQKDLRSYPSSYKTIQ